MFYVSLFFSFLIHISLSKQTPLLCGSKREELLGTSAKFLDYGKETQKQKQTNEPFFTIIIIYSGEYFILREFKNKPYTSFSHFFFYMQIYLIGVEGCQGNSSDPK